MSKVDEATWITLSITMTPDDFQELEDIIDWMDFTDSRKSGLLTHIAEQYKLKREELCPKEFSREDLLFIQEIVKLGKTSEGSKIIRNSPYIARKILDLHDKYGINIVDKTIQNTKKHEENHECAKANQA